MRPSWREVFNAGRGQLMDAGIADAALDARLLLQHAGGVEHHRIISLWPDPCPPAVEAAYSAALARRALGEPVSRIIGRRQFLDMELEISIDVLDPRADTELLVETVIAHAPSAAMRFCDIGTGSGAIAIAILRHFPDAQCVATDKSAKALAIAQRNAERHGVANRMEFCQGSYLEPLGGLFDVIVSNPPYIVRDEIAGLAPEVRNHDPHLALDGGVDGLDAYRAIFMNAGSRLNKGGHVFVETGFDQAAAVTLIARTCGFAGIQVVRDIAGHDRVLWAGWPA